MASVPYSPIPSVSPTLSSGTPYQSSSAATPDAFGADVGRAQQRFGTELDQLGGVLADHALKMQAQANQAAAKELFVTADADMGNLDIKFRSLEGANAVNAYPQYQKDILALREKYKREAPNPEVARLFDNDFARRATFNIIDGARYSAGQNKVYNSQASKAVVDNTIKDAATNPYNDNRFSLNLDMAEKAVIARSESEGWPAEKLEAEKNATLSALWSTRIEKIAMTDPFKAEKLYNEHKEGIKDGLQQMRIEKVLEQQKVAVGTRIRSDEITAGFGLPQATKVNAAKPNEFWGDPDAPDFAEKHLTTIKTKGGIPVTVNKQAAASFEGFLNELEALGYPLEIVGGYSNRNKKGSNEKSQHAYGNAIDVNPSANPMLGGGKVVTNLPPGVSQIAAKYGLSWGGDWKGGTKDTMHFEWSGVKSAPLTPESEGAWLGAAIERARIVAKQDAPDNPLYEDALIQRVKTNYANIKTAKTETDIYNFNLVKGAVIGNGVNVMRSMDAIYSDATLNQAYHALTPSRQDQIRKNVEANAKADIPLTPEGYTRFQTAMGQAITSPSEFLALDPMSMEIPRTLKSQIFTKQREMAGKLQDTTRINSALRTVGPMLNDAGIGPSSNDQGKAGVYNQFVGAFDSKLKDWEAEKKKFPTEEEQRQIAAGLLTETTNNWFFANTRAFEVPSSFVDEWKPKFKTRYGRDPTPSEMFTLYQRSTKP